LSDRVHLRRISNTTFLAALLSLGHNVSNLHVLPLEANVEIIVDFTFNPMYDEQVMKRIHRIGQENPCFIYRLQYYDKDGDTLDKSIWEKQKSKSKQADNVFKGLEEDDEFQLTAGILKSLLQI